MLALKMVYNMMFGSKGILPPTSKTIWERREGGPK